MTTTKCGRSITIDISQIDPGNGEAWIAGDPVVIWGDGTQSTSVSGTTASHTYQAVGMYTITLEGENTCGNVCTHDEIVVVIENPTGLQARNISVSGATISWNAVNGTPDYRLVLYRGTTFIDLWEPIGTSKTLTNLLPDTTYDAYVSALITADYISEEYCGDNKISFTTLGDVCEPPVCYFTVHD